MSCYRVGGKFLVNKDKQGWREFSPFYDKFDYFIYTIVKQFASKETVDMLANYLKRDIRSIGRLRVFRNELF